jgi:hypothetical protein
VCSTVEENVGMPETIMVEYEYQGKKRKVNLLAEI